MSSARQRGHRVTRIPEIVAGRADAQQALMERQARPRTAGERAEARSAARERRDEVKADRALPRTRLLLRLAVLRLVLRRIRIGLVNDLFLACDLSQVLFLDVHEHLARVRDSA